MLAEKGVIDLADPVDREKSIYRVYCPKCRTWHTAHLSGYPREEHFHLSCGEILPYAPKHRAKL